MMRHQKNYHCLVLFMYNILDLPLIEASALDSTNIQEAFKNLINEVYNSFLKNAPKKDKETPNINQGKSIKIEDKKVEEDINRQDSRGCCGK